MAQMARDGDREMGHWLTGRLFWNASLLSGILSLWVWGFMSVVVLMSTYTFFLCFSAICAHICQYKHCAWKDSIPDASWTSFVCVCVLLWRLYTGVWNIMHVSSLCLQMLYEIGQAQSKPCGINLARANTLGGLLIIEKASAPINVAL